MKCIVASLLLLVLCSSTSLGCPTTTPLPSSTATPPSPSTTTPPPPPVRDEYEVIAQAACTSMAIKRNDLSGWTFAVQRKCDSQTASCNTICGNRALHRLDAQTANSQWSCLGAIHVYKSQPYSLPNTISNPSIGLKVYWNPSYHLGRFCGPNYCCCHAH